MPDVVPGDLVVVRFSPISVEKLRETAQEEYADRERRAQIPWYAVSTFAMRIGSETDEELLARLCSEVLPTSKNIHVVTERLLRDAGFDTVETSPPIHHYDVVLGDELRDLDVERLSQLFMEGRRRNLSWKK
ncbi:hypothetical protein I4I73_17290 [Pseudonocardia sp. KRD-184]|uniref:Uncharacterized protein n=1 Tax=Pseudonocardia oceani TaxID=2792013 RepID=A0ABS6U746_9PSEU|nr:hypothetical protein [Pseudonocardia oceani]MBW0090617.1 hypothetical protein [Pseudonocardia oceani]MBW0097737.1 hypothetical protein [Pseudonocardia oceani]MBW0110326.1 hypothetical protein [Pseudonocardia oceani]MBW0120846.1 hypothetical protein [Pseudonocardia oceani]MBW0128057.1 hypothetical protein [Pseudonocardia oceani]